MAGEIEADYVTGNTLYAQVRNSVGQIWRTDTHVFEAYSTANIAHYNIALAEQGTASGYYVGDFPTQIVTAGPYNVVAKRRAGGSPAESDATTNQGTLDWDGNGTVMSAANANVTEIVGNAATGLQNANTDYINDASFQANVSTWATHAVSVDGLNNPSVGVGAWAGVAAVANAVPAVAAGSVGGLPLLQTGLVVRSDLNRIQGNTLFAGAGGSIASTFSNLFGSALAGNPVAAADVVWGASGTPGVRALTAGTITTTVAPDLATILSAVYDSASVSGNTITLSNGHTQTITGAGRVTT